MAINLEDIRNQRQKELDDFLVQRDSDISSLSPSVNQSFLQDALSSLQLPSSRKIDQSALNASIQSKLPILRRQSQALLSQSKFNRERMLQNILFNENVRKAQDAGLSEQDSIEFARKQVNQRKEQESSVSENEENKKFKLKQENLANIFADRGINLQNIFANMRQDRTGAILRLLFGTGAAIGTGFALRKFSNSDSVNPLKKEKSQFGGFGETELV